MITFHPNEACLIELETLKCSQMKSINEFLPVEATRLCRHGIAANFNTAEETGFICVAEISSEDVEKVDHKSVKKSEKDETFKGKNLWVFRLKMNDDCSSMQLYNAKEESMIF